MISSIETLRRNLNSVSKNWAFVGQLAQIGHLLGMGLLDPRKPVKIKSIDVVIPLRKLFNFHAMFLLKGYRLTESTNNHRYMVFEKSNWTQPVVVHVRTTMPRTMSYDQKNRIVSIAGVPNGSTRIKRIQNFHRTIQNLQNNIN
jgi:hypothetical protein